MMKMCYYTEMGSIMECDKIDESETRAWFEDSYNYHTGTYPTPKQIDDFMSGKDVDENDGYLEMSWNMSK